MQLAENATEQYWRDRQREPWIVVTELGPDQGRLRITVRPSRTSDGVAVNALLVERVDGRALAVRDLRRVKLPYASTLRKYLEVLPGDDDKLIAPARPGSPGHPLEHWRQVYELWEQAQVEAPRSPIKWVREQYDTSPPDATVRRWVKRARQMHDKEEL